MAATLTDCLWLDVVEVCCEPSSHSTQHAWASSKHWLHYHLDLDHLLTEAKMVSKKKKLAVLLATFLAVKRRQRHLRQHRTLWSRRWVSWLQQCAFDNLFQELEAEDVLPFGFANFVFAHLYWEQFHNHLPPAFPPGFCALTEVQKSPIVNNMHVTGSYSLIGLHERFVAVGCHGHVHIKRRVPTRMTHDPTSWMLADEVQHDEILVVGPVTLPDYCRFSCLVWSDCRSSAQCVTAVTVKLPAFHFSSERTNEACL